MHFLCSCPQRCSQFTAPNHQRSITRSYSNVGLSKSWVRQSVQCHRNVARCCVQYSIRTKRYLFSIRNHYKDNKKICRIYSFWQSRSPMSRLYLAILGQGPDRQHSLLDGVQHFGAAGQFASGHNKFIVFLHFAVHHNATKCVRGSGVSFVSIGIVRHNVGVSVLFESGPPLSTVGMSDDAET